MGLEVCLLPVNLDLTVADYNRPWLIPDRFLAHLVNELLRKEAVEIVLTLRFPQRLK
jgi:hypothetical protein